MHTWLTRYGPQCSFSPSPIALVKNEKSGDGIHTGMSDIGARATKA